MKGEESRRTGGNGDPVVDLERIVHDAARRLHLVDALVARALDDTLDVLVALVLVALRAQEAAAFLLRPPALALLCVAHLALLLVVLVLGRLVARAAPRAAEEARHRGPACGRCGLGCLVVAREQLLLGRLGVAVAVACLSEESGHGDGGCV